jgi:hypothetical protein
LDEEYLAPTPSNLVYGAVMIKQVMHVVAVYVLTIVSCSERPYLKFRDMSAAPPPV